MFQYDLLDYAQNKAALGFDGSSFDFYVLKS